MPIPSTSIPPARFGPFEVDFRAGELLKNGRRIRLQDQPLQVLALLLEHPGEIVTREELHQKLWPNDTFVDFDHGVNNAINRLRETLCDSPENPRYIETLPRRGYRFISRVEREGIPDLGTAQENSLVAQSLEQAGSVTTLHASLSSWRTRRIVFGTAVLVLSSLLGLAVSVWKGKFSGSAHAMRIEAIAVLPLENMTGDPAQEYLVDGMTDALTTHLAQMQGIRVISRTSAIHLKGTKKALPEIAKELHVDAVLEGSVSRSNDVMHVNAQLIYAPGDRHIWARSYEGATSNLSAMESEIANDIAHKIGVEAAGSSNHLSRAAAVNPEAYDLYLRSEPYYGLETREANDQAIRLLEKSVEIDPQFAAGYAALATAYRTRAFSVEINEPKWMEKANAAVVKALALDPNLAEGYVSRGYLLWSRANGWSHQRAVSDYRHALELNPNLAEAHHQLANVYNHAGVLDKADEEIKKAVAVDPLNTGIRYRVGITLLYQGKYEESLSMMRDSQKFMPSLWAFQTSFALQHMGRHQEAQERIDELLKTGPPDRSGSLTSMQALLAAHVGDAPVAERKIQEAVAKGRGYQHFHHVAYAVASAYALLNKPGPALQYLRMAADDGFPCYPLFEHDSNLDSLRKNPQFLSFMTEQKKQWEYFRAHM
jgi:TolB-like protein/DNA-binding winged helix-turn-helix (wHTH) protein